MSIVINEASYSLPVRSFIIDYSVSQHRQLPVVKEFVVRFLFSIGKCSPDILMRFFGFTTPELLAVVADLEEENLISWHGEDIGLTGYAHECFEKVGEKNLPRFFEVSDEVDRVSFDLLDYRLISDRATALPSPANVDIRLPKEAFDGTAGKAKTAFDDKFTEFLEKIKKVDVFNEHHELYKINSVSPDDDRMLPIKVEFSLESAKAAAPILAYADDWLNEWDDERRIIGAISRDVVAREAAVSANNAALSEYRRVACDPVIDRVSNGRVLDLDAAMRLYQDNGGRLDDSTHVLIGNIYTTKNANLVRGLLESAFDRDGKVSAKGGIWTVSPAATQLWGFVGEVGLLIDGLNRRFDKRFNPGRMILCMPAPNAQEAKKMDEIYFRSNAILQGVNSVFGGDACEVLHIPEAIVACIFHLRVNGFGKLTVPVGYVSTDSKYVDAVGRKISAWISDEVSFNKYFRNKRVKYEDAANKLISRIYK